MKYQIALDTEIIVDNFAGGGGASCGIEQALQRPVNIAINHDREAISMHEVNHPLTEHHIEDVWKVKPAELCRNRPIGLAWFSPDCKHFSKAKGGKPVEKKIRGLAWVVLRWASLPLSIRPRVIALENVEEFLTWGPLLSSGLPDPAQKGRTFNSFVNALKKHGYVVSWKELKACDYGAPTIRKRLFLIARRDGQPIIWPKPTHGPKGSGLLPYRTAAECIDWSIPCPSIFDRARPLQDNTLRRIARGLKRYVIDAQEPFIVRVNHGDSGGRREFSLREPHLTVTQTLGEGIVSPHVVNMAHGGKLEGLDNPFSTIATEKGGCRALVTPFLAGVGGRAGQSPERGMDKPYHTTTAKADTALVAPYMVGAGGSEYAGKPRTADAPMNVMTTHNRSAVIAPSLIEVGYGERPGQEPRAPGLDKPLGTVVAGGQKHAVIAAHLQSMYGNSVGSDMAEPAPSVMGKTKQSLASVFLAQHNTGMTGHPADKPMSTIVGRGTQQQLVASYVTKMRGENVGHEVTEPLHTVSAGGTHHAETRAFLVKYFGTQQDPRMEEPMHTVTTKDRFGLATVEMSVPPHLTDEQRYTAWWTVRLMEKFGEIEDKHPAVPEPRAAFIMVGAYIIVDIGMRMLAPRELYRAQGFPEDYIIDRTADGKPLTKTAQVRMCGNSVCPPLSRAIVAANMHQSSLFMQEKRQKTH